ncbi:MAG: bifunctional [glutamate--ammonia ligase]-adenylyl-L-tyrosine phosphorylase/[glutamate--ammonia-ligase] adenylyltransferase [Candidatus Hydrogenedentes bacterium]|nr:bifunctional [glutamate--ammonia ligase]-adenylyl-L-tyrosine phosphorylase/[glutamate--ammonia-ligase] adenylyltransferase [Candidatus Hydrogenedentota bacterium]
MRPEFSRVAFTDPGAAGQTLDALIGENRNPLAENLAAALEESPDANLALVRLGRYLDASRTPKLDLDLMEAAPAYARLVVIVLGQSHFLTDIVCRNPEYMMWLWEEADLGQTRQRADVVGEALKIVSTFDTFETRCEALRRFRRREILRIAARDIVAHSHVAAVADDLSNFADAACEAAIRCAQLELEPRYGKPMADDSDREASFVALGMGKLGARELNFSSDIDLVFLFDEDGRTQGGASPPIANSEYFHKLGERMIKVLAEQTAEGAIFRVDMRLRPHGRMGPLVVDVDSAIRYYEGVGHAWERQALIKARPVAGDLELGARFVERTRPFVFPKFFDDDTLEDIRNGKQQMEAQIAQRGETDIEVKLGRGGIRDIEFTVQMLQLLNGGRIPELRVAPTLRAIRALGEHHLLSPLDAQTLSSNYVFLRHVEHRLQIEGSQQRHRLPSDPVERDAFARRLGYANGASFMNDYSDRANATREILDLFLATEGGGNLWVTDLLNPHSDGAAGKDGMRALGFGDVEAARRELLSLYTGRRERPHTLHVRQRFLNVAPMLIQALSRANDPDATLLRLAQIFSGLRAPGVIYDMLAFNPELTGQMVRLIEDSPYLSELLVRDPGLFDTVGRRSALERFVSRDELEAELASLRRAVDGDAAPYRLHSGETLRIGMRDLVLGVDVIEISRELTQLAEVCLGFAIDGARESAANKFGECSAGFAVLALGKFAGRELGYGSDLDLVFVYESGVAIACGASPIEYFTAVASHIIRTLKEPTKYGHLYDVDARLRPDGGKGSLVVSDARLREYYRNDAQAWERLALVKVRAVGGDAEFAARIEAETKALAYALPVTRENLDQIEDIRTRLAASSSPLSLKKSDGGMAELEFGIRLLQLEHAPTHPEVARRDVSNALEALSHARAIDAGDAAYLRDTYLLFRRIENRLRVQHGRSTSILPGNADERNRLGKRLGISGDLLSAVNERRAAVHRFYTSVLKRLRARGATA